MNQAKIKFQQMTISQSAKLETVSSKIVVLVDSTKVKSKAWAKPLGAALEERCRTALSRQPEDVESGTTIKITGREKSEADLWIVTLPEDKTTFDLLGFARGIVKASIDKHSEKIAFVVLESKWEAELADAVAAAIGTHTFQMPVFGKKAKKIKAFKLNEVFFVSSKNHLKALQYSFHTSYGTNLVRYLGTLPPNELDPVSYAKIIKTLSSQYGLQFKFHSNKELKKMGAGAFTAVDQGNPDSSGGIFEITYSPRSAKNKNLIALVGKGLCYDTGGHDIKTGGYMLTMKGDMQGSALAFANLIVAAELKIPLKMKAFLAVTENYLSPKAYKADDVVVALNGMSIEVINTDAEGRMVLADTLCLASKSKPELMVDFATLTGAATIALGQSISAGFTNREELHSKIVAAGRDSGERVWTFPLEKDYGKPLESQVADIIQCIKGRGPDHIYAAYFLKEFVDKDIPWVHIDLAAADKEGGLAHVDSLFTGFGVRWTMQFLKNKYKF